VGPKVGGASIRSGPNSFGAGVRVEVNKQIDKKIFGFKVYI